MAEKLKKIKEEFVYFFPYSPPDRMLVPSSPFKRRGVAALFGKSPPRRKQEAGLHTWLPQMRSKLGEVKKLFLHLETAQTADVPRRRSNLIDRPLITPHFHWVTI